MKLITTPIPYTNAQPHLGHLLEGVFNDTIARFYRRVGDGEVNLTMGLDQHGLKIYQAAQKAGQPIEEFVAEQGKTFEHLWKQFNVQYDSWVPTTSREHQLISQLFWKRLERNGMIYKKSYKGLYNMYDEVFILEKDLDENGDLPGRPGVKPIKMEEENYFFALTKMKQDLVNYLYESDIKPQSVKKELINFLEDELQDVSFSRDKSKLPWGIPVPGDDSQVIYVWCDALVNYATACVNLETIDRWYELEALREEIEKEIWEELDQAFPVDVMYVGKDIVRFHLVYWPAMLMSVNLTPPLKTLVHGMINDGQGRKFSKSLGNGVLPQELVEKFGIDGSRFLLLHEVNITGDTAFSWPAMTEAYNSHLANNIGNLLMRVTTLCEAHFPLEIDLELAEKLVDFTPVYSLLNELNAKDALEEVLKAGRVGNELLEQTKPWTMIKNGEKEQALKVLVNLAGLLKTIGEEISMFLPQTGAQIIEAITELPMKKAVILFNKVELGK
jgi:methionyl-tRNA synthetase